MEEVSWLKEEKIELPFALDASVYAWNREAVHTLKEMGPEFITMPWELNSRELKAVAKACERDGIPGELVIYGHAPMMVSAQCVVKTLKGCTAKREHLIMKDRTGAGLPLKAHCNFCYNTILNPLPLSLFGNEEAVRELNMASLRLSFTREGKEETQKILEAFCCFFYRRKRNCRTSERFYKRTFQTGSRIAYDKSDRGSIQISDDIADGHLYLCQFPFLFFPGSGTEEKSVCKAEPGHVFTAFSGICGDVSENRR